MCPHTDTDTQGALTWSPRPVDSPGYSSGRWLARAAERPLPLASVGESSPGPFACPLPQVRVGLSSQTLRNQPPPDSFLISLRTNPVSPPGFCSQASRCDTSSTTPPSTRDLCTVLIVVPFPEHTVGITQQPFQIGFSDLPTCL